MLILGIRHALKHIARTHIKIVFVVGMIIPEDILETAAERLPLADRGGVVGLEGVFLRNIPAIHLAAINRGAGHLVIVGLGV